MKLGSQSNKIKQLEKENLSLNINIEVSERETKKSNLIIFGLNLKLQLPVSDCSFRLINSEPARYWTGGGLN